MKKELFDGRLRLKETTHDLYLSFVFDEQVSGSRAKKSRRLVHLVQPKVEEVEEGKQEKEEEQKTRPSVTNRGELILIIN